MRPVHLNFYCAALWCNFTASAFRRIKVAYNNTFRMLMCVKRRQVYNAFVRFNVDSLQVILRKSVYSFNKRLLKSRNCIISNIMNSMSFLSGSKLHAHWEKVLYNLWMIYRYFILYSVFLWRLYLHIPFCKLRSLTENKQIIYIKYLLIHQNIEPDRPTEATP